MNNSTSISKGAKIAIAAGVAIVIVGIIALIYYLSSESPAIVKVPAQLPTQLPTQTPPVQLPPQPVPVDTYTPPSVDTYVPPPPVYVPPVQQTQPVQLPPVQPTELTYLGCYTDMAEPNRAIPYVGEKYSITTCRDKAKTIGAKIFGLQFGNAETGLGQCLTSAGTTAESAKKYGVATNCAAMPRFDSLAIGAAMGGPGSNAVYMV